MVRAGVWGQEESIPVANTIGASPRTHQVSCQLGVPSPQLSALQAKAGICDLAGASPVQMESWQCLVVLLPLGHPFDLRPVTKWFGSPKSTFLLSRKDML